MYNEIWSKTETLESHIKNIEKTLNTTKTENQNSLRALMLQVGKIGSKENTSSDGMYWAIGEVVVASSSQPNN